MVDILHEERELYEEVAYVANNLAGALDAAGTGTRFKNPVGQWVEPWHWHS